MKIRLFPIAAFLLVCALGYQMFDESTYFTSYVSNVVFNHNLHEVVPGRFYRSAEMSRKDLAQVVSERGIRSVIDLRIDEDGIDSSGKSEAQAVSEVGGTYRHIAFSSRRADQRESILKLLQAYSELPPPILVHCSSGTHRSGVASAIWLLEKEGRTPNEAAQQLSLKYGFLQWERDLKALIQGKPTLDRVISAYQETRGNSTLAFSDWAAEAPILGPLKSNSSSGVQRTSASLE